MVVLISACRVSGGQLFGFSFSHRCASVVRMSANSFCCSFTRWFKLFLFNMFVVVVAVVVVVVVVCCCCCCCCLFVCLFVVVGLFVFCYWFLFFLGRGGCFVVVGFFCGVFEVLVQEVIWHPLHLFCMDSLACLLPSSGSTPVVFSILATGVVFMAPRIVLKPMF